MARFHGWTISAGALAVALLAAGSAEAGATGGSSSSGSTGSSSGCGCVSTTHQVRVPGVEITAPSVTVNLPTLNVSGASAYSNSSASASVNTEVNVAVSGSASSAINTQALVNSAAFGGGGSGSFSDSGSVSTTIDSVKVESPTPLETRRICALFKSETKMMAIQANCLDDKDVPHPASQVFAAREVEGGYDGEIYRCIAGARMQYAVAEYAGQADFGHGQTFTCGKGEALYHSPLGGVQCRAQKPARDCNERSLLRRFGAGIKVLKVERKDICAEWRTVTVEANAAD